MFKCLNLCLFCLGIGLGAAIPVHTLDVQLLTRNVLLICNTFVFPTTFFEGQRVLLKVVSVLPRKVEKKLGQTRTSTKIRYELGPDKCYDKCKRGNSPQKDPKEI